MMKMRESTNVSMVNVSMNAFAVDDTTIQDSGVTEESANVSMVNVSIHILYLQSMVLPYRILE